MMIRSIKESRCWIQKFLDYQKKSVVLSLWYNLQAAKLAVMLPAPKKYDLDRKNPYLGRRANVILKRMRAAQIPDDEGV